MIEKDTRFIYIYKMLGNCLVDMMCTDQQGTDVQHRSCRFVVTCQQWLWGDRPCNQRVERDVRELVSALSPQARRRDLTCRRDPPHSDSLHKCPLSCCAAPGAASREEPWKVDSRACVRPPHPVPPRQPPYN